MLTDQDKERILLEETYRREIREQFEQQPPSKTRWERVSPILNSAFVLWFLSSVILGVVGFLYARWDSQRTIERDKKASEAQVKRENELIARKLDAEIANRLIVFAQLNDLAIPDNTVIWDLTDKKNTDMLKKTLIELENPTLGEYKLTVFPEYANRSLRSLLFELKEVVPDEQKAELDNAYKKSVVLLELYLGEIQQRHDVRLNFKGAVEIYDHQTEFLGELSQALNLKRWNHPFNVYEERR